MSEVTNSARIYATANWPETRNRVEFQPAEIHVWLADLNSVSTHLGYLKSCLDRRELARMERYSVERSKRRFVSSRSILKVLLGLYCQSSPQDIRLDYGPLGKPYLKQNRALQFNTTDSQDVALYVFSNWCELGVDLELATRQVRHELIAPRKFTQEEYQQYTSCTKSRQRKFFLSLWTRKESYGKALGVGIRYPLNSVNLSSQGIDQRTSVKDKQGRTWEIIQITSVPQVIASVVTEGCGYQPRFFRFSANCLRS